MKPNMGTVDRVVRGIIAVAIAVLYFTGTISGIVATVLAIVAVIFIATSAVGTCPAYLPFGLSTRKSG
jgi:hypothetical protein